MIEAQSPQDGAYNQRDARSRQQRARMEQPEDEAANIAAAIDHLQKELQRLKAWKEKLHGKDGIKVSGDCISLAERLGGDEQAVQTLTEHTANEVINGTVRIVRFYVAEAPEPV